MVNELWVLGEIVLLTVFQHEVPIFFKQRKGFGGYLVDALQRVGRVGKDEVEPALAGLQKPEGIALDEGVVVNAQFSDTLAYEGSMVAVKLYADHLAASSGKQLKGYAPRAAEEVEGLDAVKVDVALKNIKNVLLSKVSSGTCLERTWHIEMTSFIFTGNDSQRFNEMNRLMFNSRDVASRPRQSLMLNA